MNSYIIEVTTTGHEVYTIYASSEEEAKEILYSGSAEPVVSEVTSMEIESIMVQP
jgi:hypothetical protein